MLATSFTISCLGRWFSLFSLLSSLFSLLSSLFSLLSSLFSLGLHSHRVPCCRTRVSLSELGRAVVALSWAPCISRDARSWTHIPSNFISSRQCKLWLSSLASLRFIVTAFVTLDGRQHVFSFRPSSRQGAASQLTPVFMWHSLADLAACAATVSCAPATWHGCGIAVAWPWHGSSCHRVSCRLLLPIGHLDVFRQVLASQNLIISFARDINSRIRVRSSVSAAKI